MFEANQLISQNPGSFILCIIIVRGGILQLGKDGLGLVLVGGARLMYFPMGKKTKTIYEGKC